MLVGAFGEANTAETRSALVPESVKRLVACGAEVRVTTGLGLLPGFQDQEYEAAGATIEANRASLLATADILLRVGPPLPHEVERMRAGAVHISFLDPFNNGSLVDALASKQVSAIAMEMIPRTTLAQKMDALSSQANLVGYVAVLLAAARLDSVFPMLMTPAGTLRPAKVFIIGCGVAGLQAVATAKRLGARVEAFDTRPAVEEQIHSLGAKFLKIDLGETGEAKGGYATELSEEQKRLQREAMAKAIAQADVVLTAAQVFGRRAPVLVTESMVREMRPGSVVVDLAIDTGGNVECSSPGEDATINGVHVLGYTNLPGRVPRHASQMYSSNLSNLIEHFWNKEEKRFCLNLEDEIMDGCLICHAGQLRSKMLLDARKTAHG